MLNLIYFLSRNNYKACGLHVIQLLHVFIMTFLLYLFFRQYRYDLVSLLDRLLLVLISFKKKKKRKKEFIRRNSSYPRGPFFYLYIRLFLLFLHFCQTQVSRQTITTTNETCPIEARVSTIRKEPSCASLSSFLSFTLTMAKEQKKKKKKKEKKEKKYFRIAATVFSLPQTNHHHHHHHHCE